MIYFLRSNRSLTEPKKGWIKIGSSIRLSARLRQHARALRHTPTLLAVHDGGLEEEKQLHRRFASIRAGRHRSSEWFYSKPELRDYIESEGQVWDEVDEIDRDSGVIRIPPDVIRFAKILAVSSKTTITDVIVKAIRPILEDKVGELARRGVRRTDDEFAEEWAIQHGAG